MTDKDGHPGRRRLALAALMLLIIMAGIYLLPRRPPPPPATPPSQPSSAPTVGLRSVQTEAPSIPKPIESVAQVSGDTLDFCGLGKVAVDAHDPFAGYRYLEGATRKTAQQWLSALLNNDDTRARAVGLLLEGKIGEESLTMHPMQEQTRDELVALAVGAGDPAVYALTLAACGTYTTQLGGNCQQLSVAEWARLDPDNAMPWLLLAGQAHGRNDASAESDDFDHAAAAHKMDSYNASLFAYAAPTMPSDATALQQWYLTIQATGIDATMRPPLGQALRHCTDSAVQDDHARAQCIGVAEVMVNRGATLADFGLGISLGARLGWPEQRVRKLREQYDAMIQVFTEEGDEGEEDKKGIWSCAVVERGNAFMRQRVQAGELSALRDQIERSGEAPHELAQKHREFMDKMRLEAQREETAPVP